MHRPPLIRGFKGFANLSLGRAVHARLWEVPAEICWMATPSNPITFLGLVMGPVEFPWPHWPMELLPQAYTSLSLTKSERKCVKTKLQQLFNSQTISCTFWTVGLGDSWGHTVSLTHVSWCPLKHTASDCLWHYTWGPSRFNLSRSVSLSQHIPLCY